MPSRKETYAANHADWVPHLAPDERDAQNAASQRTWTALMLTTTPEAWAALTVGQPVPQDQLDHVAQARQSQRVGRP